MAGRYKLKIRRKNKYKKLHHSDARKSVIVEESQSFNSRQETIADKRDDLNQLDIKPLGTDPLQERSKVPLGTQGTDHINEQSEEPLGTQGTDPLHKWSNVPLGTDHINEQSEKPLGTDPQNKQSPDSVDKQKTDPKLTQNKSSPDRQQNTKSKNKKIKVPWGKKNKSHQDQNNKPSSDTKGNSKKVHIAPLPDRYEPLEEGAEDAECRAEKQYKRKQKAKKYAKNVGKAMLTGCRYMLIGFQQLANAYAAPFGATTVVLSTMAR